MKNVLLGLFCIFLFFCQELNAQFLTTGNNLFSSAKFVSPGKDSSSYVVGEFLSYEIENGGNPNITSYGFEIGDSLVLADSCGFAHFTSKIYAAKISDGGAVDWIRISENCDTISTIQIVEIASDDDQNLIILGAFNTQVELSDSILVSDAKWDMFLYKISPEGKILWQKNMYAVDDTSAVIPRDLVLISNDIYVSGSYYGKANFAGKTFQSKEEQFFLFKADKNGNDLEISAGVPFHEESSSILYEIDYLSNNDICGILSAKDSVLVINKAEGSPADSIYIFGGFKKDLSYIIDSIDVSEVISVADSFYVANPPFADQLFYIVDSAAVLNRNIIKDSIYIRDYSSPKTQKFISIFRGDSLALSIDVPDIPIDFLVDRNDNSMYGLHNYSHDLRFGADLISAYPYQATALVKYNFSGGLDWFKCGYALSDTVQSNSFCIDPTSNIYLCGSVGRQAGNHLLNFDNQDFTPSYDKDCFVVKVSGGLLAWGQILGDSAADKFNDIYALDRFNIVGAGEYSTRIKYDKFDISSSGIRDLFVGSIQPYPSFDLNVNSFRNEDEPLCDGDSILLIASSAHNCSFQWMKDSLALAGEANDTLWVHYSGSYYVQATSATIKYDNLSPYGKSSQSFFFDYHSYPNDTIRVKDSTVFCLGDKTTLSIELNTTDSCSWYEVSDGFLVSANHITLDRTGLYYSRIEGKSGCVSMSDTLSILTIDPPNDSLTILGGNNLFCSGNSLELACHDLGINTYVWYKDGDSLTTVYSPNISFDAEGSYSVKIINQHKCSAFSDTLALVEIVPPVVESWFADELTGICLGEKAEIRLSLHGGTEYFWFHDDDSIKNHDSPVYFAEEEGSYRVSVVKEGVCYVPSDTFSLAVHPYPAALIKVDTDTVICDNESTRLFVESPDNISYKWYRNGLQIDGIDAGSVNVSERGSYYSEVSNEFGCSVVTRSIPIVVKKSPDLSLNSEGNQHAFCEKDSLNLYVENSDICTYQWRRNGLDISTSGREHYVKIPGEYSVLLNDTLSDCSAVTNALQINELPLPDNTLSYEEKNPLCNRDTLLLKASSEASSFEWTIDGSVQLLEVGQEFNAYKNGSYRVLVSNVDNCSALSSPVNLTFLDSPIPPIQQDINYLSTLLYGQVQWYKDHEAIAGGAGQVYSVVESGNYYVEVTHSNGCVAGSDEIQICVPFPEIEVDHNNLSASEGETYQWFFGTDTIFGATSALYVAQLSGSYSVDISHSDGCVSRSIEVEVCYPTPEIEIQDNNVLKASLGLSYQWYLNNEAISGADARLFVVSAEGNYKVELEDLENCISFSDPVFMEVSATNNLCLASIEIYPNPFTDKISLRLPADFDYSETILEIQNALGKLIYQQTMSANPQIIQLPSLPSGLYAATIFSNTQRIHIKLIKK